jgi:low temperature requirement protein LtrA
VSRANPIAIIIFVLVRSASAREETATAKIATRPDRIERVSTLELFFDLVFVFTITQLTGLLVHDPDLLHLLQVAVLLAIIFWMYGGYAWLTNAVAADTAARRLVLLGGMAGFLLVSLTVPEAFDGGGLAFGLAYAVVVLVHIGLFTRTQRVRSARDLVRVGLLNVAGTALILVGGTIGGATQLVLWILVPLVWWLVSPYRGLSGGFDIGAAHFVERHGLVLIIAIGESLVGLALGLGGLELGPSVAVVAVLGLALSACLWWTYFGGDDTLAEQALAAAPQDRRGRMSIEAFGHADLGLLLGVIAIAAGLEAGAHEPFHALDFGHAVALGGGVALYLVSDAWFRQRLRIARPGPRALAALPALATVAVGLWVAAAQVATLVLVFAVMFALESRRSNQA